MKYLYYIFVIPLTAAIAITALFLIYAFTIDYDPIKYYTVDVVQEEVCVAHPVRVRVTAEIQPPIDELIVDSTWVRVDKLEFFEEPVAQFDGTEVPTHLDRVSPLNHQAPLSPGVWRLEETLTAKGNVSGVGRTQDFETQDQTPTTVKECN